MSLVVGIDIGNENCVVAAYNSNSSGGFVDVLLNEASKRETPLIIHFDKKQRLFGSAAASYSSRNPQATISQLKRLIGRRYDEVSFQRERHLLPYETCKGENGEILVTVDYQKQKWYFTAVELLGMFLSHLKKTAEKASGDKQITDCVIGIPSYLTNQQRKDYLMAAEIAGLKPLRLFHDGTATALDYASSREIPYGEVIHVVFIDIGHCDTQVTVVKFCCGTLTVLAHSFNRDLGGRDFDNLIFERIREIFRQNHGIDILDNVKASFQLRAACAKAKLVLSVNTEATVNKECLIGVIDVEETITRETFENVSTDLMDNIVATCEKALTDAGLTKKEIHSVELVGSGSRIPKISQVLEDVFGQKISRTLNASECIANGCALQCAMLCPTLKARTFGVQDIYPFTVVCKPDMNASLEPCNAIVEGLLFLTTKTLILHPRGHDCSISFHYAKVTELPLDVASNITSYKLVMDESKKASMEIRLQLNLDGLLTIVSACVVSKGFVKQELVHMDIDVECEGNRTANEEHTLLTLPSNENDDVREPSTTSPLEYFEFSSIPQIDLKYVFAKESLLDELDKACERAKNQRNRLESYLLGMRNAISGKPFQFASEESKKGVLTLLSRTEEWLYGSGADESEQTYIDEENCLTSACDNLHFEHRSAMKQADKDKKLLYEDAVIIHKKYVLGELGRRLTKAEAYGLRVKLQHIKTLHEEDGLRTQEEYIKKHNELIMFCNTIDDRLKEEAAKSSSQPGIFRSVKEMVGGLLSGSGPEASVKGADGDQIPATETAEISGSKERSQGKESATQVPLQSTRSRSFSDQGEPQHRPGSVKDFGSSSTITAEGIRDCGRQNAGHSSVSYNGGNTQRSNFLPTSDIQPSQSSKDFGDGDSSNPEWQQGYKELAHGVPFQQGPQAFTENPQGSKEPVTGGLQQQVFPGSHQGNQGGSSVSYNGGNTQHLNPLPTSNIQQRQSSKEIGHGVPSQRGPHTFTENLQGSKEPVTGVLQQQVFPGSPRGNQGGSSVSYNGGNTQHTNSLPTSNIQQLPSSKEIGHGVPSQQGPQVLQQQVFPGSPQGSKGSGTSQRLQPTCPHGCESHDRDGEMNHQLRNQVEDQGPKAMEN